MTHRQEKTKAELLEEIALLQDRAARLEAKVEDLASAGDGLSEAEGRYRLLIESTPMGIHQYDLESDGRLVFRGANPAAEAILGVDCSQFVGKTIEEAFPPLQATDVPERYRRAAASGEFSSWEQIDYDHEGITGAFEVYAFQTKPGSMACMFLDITKRKQAENALRESEEWFREMAEMLPQTVCEIALDGRISFVNHGALEMFGYSKSEFEAGVNIRDVMTPESFERASVVMRQVVAGSGSKGNEYTGVRKDGATFPVLIYSSPVFRGGAPAGLRAIVVNITERARAEEEKEQLERQVQQAQKLESLGVLAGGIAHDFNNLLLGIMGNADLALMDLPSTSPGRESIEAVLTSARRAADLCKQMLAYSGKGHFVVQAVDLSAAVEDMAHLLEVSVSKRVVLRRDFTDGIPAIEADVTQLRQVILNLIVNASDAIGDDSGLITISTGTMDCDSDTFADAYLEEELPPGKYVFLEVSDTGCGMNEEILARVFEPFFSTKSIGRGLGLAAVLGIVRGHRGTLEVQSEPGRGTVVRVLFPATEGTAIPIEPDRESNEEWCGTGTVLVVDDEETVRSVARQILERAGFEVVTAPDGAAGLELYEKYRQAIRAVVLDMTMPGMTGEEVFRELRSRYPEVLVMLSSGYDEQDAMERFAEKGLSGFIQKPYRPQELIDALKGALEK